MFFSFMFLWPTFRFTRLAGREQSEREAQVGCKRWLGRKTDTTFVSIQCGKGEEPIWLWNYV